MKTKIKKIIALLTVAIIGTSVLLAQNSGVFKTYSDYTSGKMEYGINCATEKHKIKLNQFLGKDYITVIHDGKPYELKKAQTWGYQLCDEKIIRFQGKEHYPLQEKGILWIYTKEELKAQGRGNMTSITRYYFSKGGDGEIKELNLTNVKAAFPDNHKLHDEITKHFATNASLGEFDNFHKKFVINHFLETQEMK